MYNSLKAAANKPGDECVFSSLLYPDPFSVITCTILLSPRFLYVVTLLCLVYFRRCVHHRQRLPE